MQPFANISLHWAFLPLFVVLLHFTWELNVVIPFICVRCICSVVPGECYSAFKGKHFFHQFRKSLLMGQFQMLTVWTQPDY